METMEFPVVCCAGRTTPTLLWTGHLFRLLILLNMLDLVSSITIYDGSGHRVAQTKYGYDEYSLQPSGVSKQFSTAPPNAGIRGNRTSQSRLLISTGASVTATATYYDTGTPYQVTDPGGHITTNTYDAASEWAGICRGIYHRNEKCATAERIS